jgi:hypothetical protein
MMMMMLVVEYLIELREYTVISINEEWSKKKRRDKEEEEICSNT